MTKQQTNNSQQAQKQQPEKKNQFQSESKKKIIKKFAFSKKQTVLNDQQKLISDNLKDWKPQKLKNKTNLNNSQKLEKKSQNIGIQFLTSLPKPNKSEHENNGNYYQAKKNDLNKVNIGKKIQLSEQQLKWDASDQFLQKAKHIQESQMLSLAQSKNQQGKFKEEQIQGDQYVQKIKWLNQQNNNSQKFNLLSKIDKDWQKQSHYKQQDELSDDDLKNNKKNNILRKFTKKQ